MINFIVCDDNEVIRKQVEDLYGSDVAENIIIQYGGSMNASNADELLSKPDVDKLFSLSNIFIYADILFISAIGGKPFLAFKITASVVSEIKCFTSFSLLEGSKSKQSFFPSNVIAKFFKISNILLNSIFSKYFFSIMQ